MNEAESVESASSAVDSSAAANETDSAAVTASSESTVTGDYSEDLDLIAEKMSVMDTRMETIESASSAVLVYGVVYIPLVIIVLSLWWFFRQFLDRFF